MINEEPCSLSKVLYSCRYLNPCKHFTLSLQGLLSPSGSQQTRVSPSRPLPPNPEPECQSEEGGRWRQDCNWCQCRNGVGTCTRRLCPQGEASKKCIYVAHLVQPTAASISFQEYLDYMKLKVLISIQAWKMG